MDKVITLSSKQLSLSTDKQKLLLSIIQVQQPINESDIIDLIKTSEYKDLKINTNALKEAVVKYNDIKNGVLDNQNLQSVIIAERCDAQLFITLDPLKMTAKAKIRSAFGGKNITLEQLMAAIQDLNISFGIKNSAIKLLLDKAAQAPAGTPYQITIAQGKEPINGHDAYFSALLQPAKTLLINSIKEEYGSVNMNDVESMISVQPGTKLIRKFSHLSGHDGMTVTGEVLTHTAGEDIPFHIGENTKISESDPNLLIATAYGTPVALDVGMKVESSLRILTDIAKNKVPIHHDGTLIIKGDIPAGTNITATGDITVIGFIESSEVQCSGDLFVSKGILGEKPSENSPNLNCKIKCAGSIYANFIQYAKIVVGQDLNLQYQLIHCSVLSGGAINVINKEQQKGTIFGGYLCARKGIHTVTLGAISGVKTIVDLNPYYEQLHNHKKHLNSLIKQIKEKLQGAFDAQHKLTRLEYSEKTIQLSKRLISTIKELKNQLSLLNDKIEDNQNRTQHYLTNTNVTARKAVHLNVSVSIGKEIFKAKQKYGATTIRIKNHKLAAETYRE